MHNLHSKALVLGAALGIATGAAAVAPPTLSLQATASAQLSHDGEDAFAQDGSGNGYELDEFCCDFTVSNSASVDIEGPLGSTASSSMTIVGAWYSLDLFELQLDRSFSLSAPSDVEYYLQHGVDHNMVLYHFTPEADGVITFSYDIAATGNTEAFDWIWVTLSTSQGSDQWVLGQDLSGGQETGTIYMPYLAGVRHTFQFYSQSELTNRDYSAFASSLSDVNIEGSISARFSIDMGTSSAVVPEPASWAMLIAGFGLVGAAARRRGARLQQQ